MISSPLDHPLAKELILVESRGMERWVSLELARRLGISANIGFLFPRALAARLFSRITGPRQSSPFFSPDVVAWKILQMLPGLKGADFAILEGYLKDPGDKSFSLPKTGPGESGGSSGLKAYQLARHLAETFEKYLLFRRELLVFWDKGDAVSPEEKWQGHIWRLLFPEDEPKYYQIPELIARTLRRDGSQTLEIPGRLTVFGVSSLPALYLDILTELSQHIEINIFLLNPSREYWGDILSEREIDRQIRRVRERNPGREISPGEIYLDRTNSLLASWGAQGRDFFAAIVERAEGIFDYFQEPGEASLLHCLQQDLFILAERGEDPQTKKEISPPDRSLTIHSCPGPLREVEVLYDQILAMFEEIPGLKPQDILVMTTDIDTYAPFVEAVFSSPAQNPSNSAESAVIPFSIADLGVRRARGVISTYLRILDLSADRYGAEECFSLLESAGIRKRFDLKETELSLIRDWIAGTRICWGMDGESKRGYGLPPFQENTWQAGLDRLFLGYAAPGGDRRLFQGISPYDPIEGSQGETLGKFAGFLDGLFHYTSLLDGPRNLSDWSALLSELLWAFFEVDDPEAAEELRHLNSAIKRLSRLERDAAFSGQVDLEVIKYHLSRELDERFEYGFLARGITFSALKPMRAVPFKVICLLGLNSGSFPRQEVNLGFDLLKRRPRPSDPSIRRADRYLFLEALISARERLYISYVGREEENGGEILPSTVVGELLDYINQGFYVPGEKVIDRLVIRHPLHPFSPEYFSGATENRLFSYSRENCRGAAAASVPGDSPLSFFDKALDPPTYPEPVLDLADLAEFYRHPARYLLKYRLGLYLPEGDDPLTETEPITLSPLDRHLLDGIIFDGKRANMDPEELFALTKARGILPQGTLGRIIYSAREAKIDELLERLRVLTGREPPRDIPFDLFCGGFRVTGKLKSCFPAGLIRHTLRVADGRDFLPAWLEHVILNILLTKEDGPSILTDTRCGLTAETFLVDKGKTWKYSPLGKPEKVLISLIETYRQGLSKPLKLFGRSSWQWAEMVLKSGKAPETAREKVEGLWPGTDHSRGDGEDPYFKLAFGPSPAFDGEFELLTREVYTALIENLSEMKSG